MGRKKKEREILSLEILYDHKEELNELVESKDFHQLLLDEAVKVIEESLTKEITEVKLYSITNLDCFLILQRSDFSKVISKAIKLYEAEEDYDKCAELVKLKEKVNESKKRTKRSN